MIEEAADTVEINIVDLSMSSSVISLETPLSSVAGLMEELGAASDESFKRNGITNCT